MHDTRAKFVDWNAVTGKRTAEINRWRDEKQIDPKTYKLAKQKVLAELKAQALWAEKKMAGDALLQREKTHKQMMLNKAKSKKKKGGMSKPAEGVRNASMKKISMH